MNVKVLYFAQFRERLGCDEEVQTIEAGTSVGELASALLERPPLSELKEIPLMFAVNESYVETSHKLQEGDEVAFVTPMAGG